MRKVIVLVAVVAVGSTIASVAAFGRNETHTRHAAKVTILQDFWLQVVGQFQNSDVGVTPVTHMHYGYLSYVQGVSALSAAPPSERTALFTFFAKGETLPVISDGPLRSGSRVGKLTIYRDPSTNSNFTNPDTFRDGTPVLVADFRQQVIANTVTNTNVVYHQNRITLTNPFNTGHGRFQLGKIGEKFDTHFIGQNNMPGPPSGYIVGYMVSR